MRNRVRRLVIAGLLAGAATPALAEDGATVAVRFGQLEAVRQMALSPSGRQVSYIANIGNGAQVLYVVDLAAGGTPKGILKQTIPEETLHGCTWGSEEVLVCYIDMHSRASGQAIAASRLLSVSSDGKSVNMLTGDYSQARYALTARYGGEVIDRGGEDGRVLITRMFLPEDRGAGSNIASADYLGLGVESINLKTRLRTTVERPREEYSEFITDGHGNIRISARIEDNATALKSWTRHYFYRKPNSRDWFGMSTVTRDADGLYSGFDPYAVDAASNVAYGFDSNDGRRALFTMALDGSGKRELVLARPDVDVNGLITIGRHHRVVGASYATERRISDYFDPEISKLAQGLHKALPGQPLIDFVDASGDEGKLLLFAGGDTDPGTFYLYDKASRQLGQLLPVRPLLAGQTLAPMKPITFPAADGTQIPAYLTVPVGSSGKGLPAIVMPHGGPATRDEWGFDWLVQFFAARGYAVIQPNYRGSAGYGAEWFRKNGFKSWRDAIGDVNDAGRWLLREGIAAPGKLAAVGWSYGGYAVLQGQVLDADLYKATVAIAPVTDLALLKFEASSEWNADAFERFIGSGPHVTEGSPALNAARFKAPVLMFHGDHDMNANVEQSRHMANSLRAAGKSVELVEYPGLTHSLVSSAARVDMLTRADAFLRKALGIAP